MDAQALEKANHHEHDLVALYQISQTLNSSLDPNEVLNVMQRSDDGFIRIKAQEGRRPSSFAFCRRGGGMINKEEQGCIRSRQ